ncbi:MAG TPA: hypothetical protein VER79_07760, partial [Candidatus Limnocylindrales bacterium]|nr:hypothetical protein [Candidatus Limnocylindrales bacterium]
QEALEPIVVRSTLGSIRLEATPGVNARVVVKGPRIFRVRFDPERFEHAGEGVYVTRDGAYDRPPTEFTLSGTFGDCTLA